MKFVAEKEDLVKALNNVSGAVGKKNITIAILLNIKLEVKGSALSLTGTDLDIVVTSNIKVSSAKDGATTVPSQLFFDIAKKIPDGSQIAVELKSEGKIMEIKYGKSKFKLPCLNSDDYPVIEEGKAEKSFEMKTQDFVDIIDKTRFAISSDETRYYLNGIYFHSKEVGKGKKTRGVATDGHRLAMVETEMPKKCDDIGGVIIPKKTVGEMRKILEGAESTVKVSLSKSKIKLETKNTVIVSKLIDGEYPDYEKVIPPENDKVVKINKKLLAESIDRVSTVATDKHRAIKLSVTKNTLTLQVNTAEGGFGNEELKIAYDKEDFIEIGFNSRYMLDILSQMSSNKVMIKFKDGNSPAILQGENEQNALFVLMPVRI